MTPLDIAERALLLAERIPLGWLNRSALDVRWFNRWQPGLDDALAALPEMDTCPHELFRALATNPTAAPKRIALVTDHGAPVAVIALRRHKHHWEPATVGVAPLAVAPAQPGRIAESLAALAVNVRTGSWAGPLPATVPVHDVAQYPVHRIASDAGFEAYWRASGHWAVVKPARRKSRAFEFAVDAPNAIEWILGRWEERWRDDAWREASRINDMLLASRFYAGRGQLRSFLLLDGDRPVAGNTFFVHNDEMILQCTARDPAYDHAGVGTRCMDLTFQWAAEHGPAMIDLGGGHEYKAGWAPADGTRAAFSIRPAHLSAAANVLHGVRRAAHVRPRRDNGHSTARGAHA